MQFINATRFSTTANENNNTHAPLDALGQVQPRLQALAAHGRHVLDEADVMLGVQRAAAGHGRRVALKVVLDLFGFFWKCVCVFEVK